MVIIITWPRTRKYNQQDPVREMKLQEVQNQKRREKDQTKVILWSFLKQERRLHKSNSISPRYQKRSIEVGLKFLKKSAFCPFVWSQRKSGYAPPKSWETEDLRQDSVLVAAPRCSQRFPWRQGGFRFMQEELGSTWANSAVIFGPAQVKDRPIRGQDSCWVTSSALAAFRAV